MAGVTLGLLLALAAPLFLLPLEKLLPLPYLIEELAKMGIVLVLIRSDKSDEKGFPVWAAAAGLLFALSETVLYVGDMFISGSFGSLPARFVLVGALHAVTALILFFCVKKGVLFAVLGLFLAICIHYVFNYVAG